ncbi:MAG: DNA replication/repair protein RecF [Clostridia bacterium]|jgi:DNA replication and repair protein RecF|nr:DNA replication/repair protein RecF [Clostridia bacterium]
MKVISHSADGFRNLKNTDIQAHPSMNIIFGENGQGKTNIIESIWLFTGCYSFRTHKNAELVCKNSPFARSQLVFSSNEREQTAQMKITKIKEIKLNGADCTSPREMIGKFSCVVFSPSTLSIIQGAPGERRRLTDVAISLIKPNYAVLMSRYLRTLDQRNALIKKISEKSYPLSTLDAWDEALSTLGAAVISYRLDYIEKLKEKAAAIYGGISSSREKFALEYSFLKSKGETDEKRIKEILFNDLVASREADLRRLYTAGGPHSDDLIITLDGGEARAYGSQGQKRSCALALKLGEAMVMEEVTGEAPVVLLDDVMSELDEGRQRFILNYLDAWQVFITCCDPSALLRSETGKIFEVKNGTVEEKTV